MHLTKTRPAHFAQATSTAFQIRLVSSCLAMAMTGLLCFTSDAYASVLLHVTRIDETGSKSAAFLEGHGGVATTDAEGTVTWTASEDLGDIAGSWMISDLAIESNPDPFISDGFTLINTSAVAADFIVTVSNVSVDEIPFPEIAGETNYDLTDANGSGLATLSQSTSGEALYSAFFGVDGDVQTLLPPGDSLPITSTSPTDIASISGDYSNVAIWPTNALSVGETFGIRHEFRLSSFDRVTVQSTFEILPDPDGNMIPEPSSVVLAMVGMGLALGYSRRHGELAQ